MFQLGGPDSLEAVEPFLLNLFLDPDIIPMGPLGFLRRPLARLISSRRSIPVRGKYAEIGGRSPIGTLTERQRGALEEALSNEIDPVAVVAMRYWHPLTLQAVEALRKAGPLDEIVLLPLYPHFSYATTLSSLKEWRRVYGQPKGGPPERTVSQFYDHPLYIQALAQRIGSVLRQFADSSRIHLIFSAHGLPMSLVEKGDPYPNANRSHGAAGLRRGKKTVCGLAEDSFVVLPEPGRTGEMAAAASNWHHRTARHGRR